ncbi:MAG: cell division protein FtsB [Pseudomonadales bacterium]|nr:cell division protein FtsB [Pseudomonadales bacterium]RPG46701.1 MAG: cell division protein FtsB [Gammaproteobacteria bacterium TMED163]HAR89408.1 cell division protein FtsB [Gammaproteobacteria bacterium]HAU24663.1 cell division protein FtsB [Gammaproteobacteria bacterium]|tara:strand:- start:4101 stop:4370 length:270 start_codon:yes stop_codon:yes gene_type:complete
MKILLTSLAIILLSLQFQLWLGEGSVRSLSLLKSELADQQAVNADLQARNRLLEIEVVDLKNGLEAVEERARSELGMIGDDEVFYLIIE